MSIDEMNGMIEGYKKIKDFCEGGNLAMSKENIQKLYKKT